MFVWWLLVKGRIQCNSNLYHKHVVDSPICTICGSAEETLDHIIFRCAFATHLWLAIGLQPGSDISAKTLHFNLNINGVPNAQYNAFAALCCWQVWKRRNGLILRNEPQTLRQLIMSCKTEAIQWRARMPKRGKTAVYEWCRLLDQATARQN